MIIDFYKKVNVYFYVLIAQNKAFKIVYFCILFLLTFSLFPCIIESSRGTQKQEENKMTIKEMFNKDRLEAERLVRSNKSDTVIYMSGNKVKKTKYEKLLNEYAENSKIDYELGVIEKGIHEFEMSAAEVLKKSIELFIIY